MARKEIPMLNMVAIFGGISTKRRAVFVIVAMVVDMFVERHAQNVMGLAGTSVRLGMINIM
jgi:hypothetical protein